MNGPQFPSMGRLTDIDWRENGRYQIRHLIIGGRRKPCLDCHINITLENFGLCHKCWESACRKLKICAVCYKPTIFPEDFEKDDKRLLKNWDNWKRTYCSEKCRGIAKSRRWRQKNPEKKQRSNLNYLKFLEQEGDI